MAEFSLSKCLRILALKSVIDPDVDYFYRHVFRWYSKHFYTPLHEVETLPLEDVLMAYYETRYEDIASDDDRTKLIEELQELTETDAERMKREMNSVENEKIADDEYIRKLIDEERSKKKTSTLGDLKVPEKPSIDMKPAQAEGKPRKMEPFPDIAMKFSDEELAEADQFGGWSLFDTPKVEKP